MRVILEREGVTPDTADKGGRIPLPWAAEKGFRVIAKRLLEREDLTLGTTVVKPYSCLADGGGHGDIVQMLWGREDVTPTWRVKMAEHLSHGQQ